MAITKIDNDLVEFTDPQAKRMNSWEIQHMIDFHNSKIAILQAKIEELKEGQNLLKD